MLVFWAILIYVMIYLVSKFSSISYRYIIKPVLFRISPDSVHESMIKTGSKVQNIAVFNWLMRTSFKYQSEKIEIDKFGINFQNPIGLSAGIDKDVKIYRLLEAVGFGFTECGSVTLDSYQGNEQPWYTRLPKSKSIVVNSGLRSEGAEKVIERANKYPKSLTDIFPLNISIAKTNSPKSSTQQTGIKDYVDSFKLWEKNGNAKLYTINISCPNTFGGEPFTDPVSLDNLLTEIDKLKIKKPIFVKMPIDKTWKVADNLLAVCSKHNVHGITLGNLFKDRKKVKLADKFDDKIKGNFSGKPCWDASNELLARAYNGYGDRFVFSGVGGVFSAEDAYLKIRLGATFVQIATGVIFEGPMLIGQINRKLVKMLEKDGYNHISEAVGVDNAKFLKEGAGAV